MAKTHGLGLTVAVDDSSEAAQTISNDITNLDWATPRNVQDTTGVDKTAMERLLGLADCSITLNGVFNVAADQSHDVFKTVPSTSVTRTVTITVAAKVLAVEAVASDYALSRASSGELTWTVPLLLQSGTAPSWA